MRVASEVLHRAVEAFREKHQGLTPWIQILAKLTVNFADPSVGLMKNFSDGMEQFVHSRMIGGISSHATGR